MSDPEFLRQIDALFDSRDWESRSEGEIDRDIQTIVLRALDIYLSGTGPRPPIPRKRGEELKSGTKPRPPIPRLLSSLYVIAAMFRPERIQRGKSASTKK